MYYYNINLKRNGKVNCVNCPNILCSRW